MQVKFRKLAAILTSLVLAMAMAPSAFAGGEGGGGGDSEKCNAGIGNGSEGNPDCDPGNSGENDQAGD